MRGGKAEQVTVDMGQAILYPEVELEAMGEQYTVHQVGVGNPHAVIFCPDPERVRLEELGPVLECHPNLRERSNVEFVSCRLAASKAAQAPVPQARVIPLPRSHTRTWRSCP